MAGAMQTFGTTTITSGLLAAQSGNPSDIVYRTQLVYSRKMLEPTKENLVRQQWVGNVEDLQQNAGSLTLRFFKRRPAQITDVTTLTEGTAISTYTEVSIGYVDITLAQIGEAAKLSDIRSMVDILNLMKQNTEVLAEDCALKAETVAMTAFVSGLKTWSTAAGNNYGFERFAGVTPTGSSSNDWTTLAGLDAANSKFTRERALGAVTKLKAAKVPTINGRYVCAVPAELVHDMRQDTTWVAAATNSRPEALYKREVIQMDGVDYVETTASWQEASSGGAYGTSSTSGDIYTAEFYGRGALGMPKLAKTSDPWAPKVIINNQADKSDPLNQFIVVGWKALYNAGLLVVSGTSGNNTFTDYPHCVALRCKSTFV